MFSSTGDAAVSHEAAAWSQLAWEWQSANEAAEETLGHNPAEMARFARICAKTRHYWSASRPRMPTFETESAVTALACGLPLRTFTATMGRRKIEIQPITHERNRSVTFLKRKNGLFKKAYELGVLCSVDVTVIIFEKAGTHNEKLYEYCSTNDSDVQVSKRLDWDGERDTRGPADFGGEKHQHPGLLVPSAGQDYDDDDGDGDGDGDSAEEIKEPKRKKGQMSKDRRSSEEIAPSAPRHPLSHPSLPAPISTYLPTATLPVSDQRGSPHTSTPPSAHGHPPKRPRRESSGYALPTPILPNPSLPASLLGHPHPPYYPPQDDAAYRALFTNIPGGSSGGVPSSQYPYPPQQQPYRRSGAVHLSGSGPGAYGPGGPAYHPPQYAHSMFTGATNPFASLIAASGAGQPGGSATSGPGFDLEWPVHNGQDRGSPHSHGHPPGQAPAHASPPPAAQHHPQQQPNGTARPPTTEGKGGEEPEDATSWLDYLAGIPGRRDAAPSAREMEVSHNSPATGEEHRPSSGSEHGASRNKRKHEE